MNNNPPYPSDDGYWMIWDTTTHDYKKSDISLPNILPEINENTKDMALYNDGEKAEWKEVKNIIPDWQQNNPEANDYIKNRCGGYDVVKTEQVNLSFNQPRAYSKEDGDVYFKPPQSNLTVWMAYESDVIPSPEELLSATINGVGIPTSDLKIFKPSDDFYYLNTWEIQPGTFGTQPPFMAVATKQTTMWGYAFDKPGLYTCRVKYQGNDVEWVTSIEYVHSAYENVKIPEKYLDLEGVVLYSSTQILTDVQKTQARANIGAGTSSFDGDYNSLTNKPTIPTKTSELNNDNGYITEAALEPYAKTEDVPTKVGQLDNDAGYVNAEQAKNAAPVQSVNAQTGAVVVDNISLGMTGAAVGQIAKITAVDADGKPTAWSPVDMPSGGSTVTWHDDLLAEGTIVANTAVNYDLGVTLAKLREYRTFLYLLKGASNANLNNLYLNAGGQPAKGTIDRGNEGGRICVLEWVDTQKTILRQTSGYSGNPSMVSTGAFATDSNAATGYGSGQWNVLRYIDLSAHAETEHLFLYCASTPTIDYAYQIRGLAK